jgi:predicted nucleotidyltransferase
MLQQSHFGKRSYGENGISIIHGIFAIHLPDAEVLAYGSRVSGTAHDGSDLDLAVRNLHNAMLIGSRAGAGQ